MSRVRKLSFDRFILDPGNASLTLEGKTIPLRPRVFELLCFLVSCAGQLVTKDQLLDAVWQRRFISESVLKDHISDLRQALGDQAQTPRYIETVTRRGYRFIAEVRELIEAEAGAGRGLVKVFAVGAPSETERILFVGREAALEWLEGHWHRALSGERQIVFLCGEAGLGKTALIHRFLNRAATNGAGGLRARCVEHFGEGEGYLPLMEALTERCRAAEGQALITALRQWAPTWLLQMRGLLKPADHEALQRELLGTTRARMLLEFCEFFEALTQNTPLVLILEDLHWSDYATLDVLSLLARRADRARLLVIGSYRPSDVVHHAVVRVRQELGMHGLCSELHLNALSAAEVGRYLNLRLGGSAVSDELLQAIYRHSDAQPLFLVNLVDHLIAKQAFKEEGGCLTWATNGSPTDISVPESLKQLMEHQLESFDPEEVRCIEAASVVGAQFSAALVAAALAADVVEVETTCERLARREQWLKPAEVEEWPDGTVAGCYSFLHGLYIAVIYQRLAPAQCARYHWNIGERLSAAYGANRREVAAQLALHFEQARNYEKAVSCLQLAADHMTGRWAFNEALEYLSRASRMVGRLPLAARTAMRTDLLLQQAAIRRSVGDMAGMAEDLKAMLSTARMTGNRRHEVQGLIDLSRAFAWIAREPCLEYARQAVVLSQTLDDEVMRAMARANHAAWSLLLREWRDDHMRALEEGLAVARRTDSPHLLHSRLGLHALIELVRSNYDVAQALATEGMGVAESLGDSFQFAMCENSRGWALIHLGRWSEACRFLETLLLRWSKNQNARVASPRWVQLAFLSVEAGDFETALRRCDEARGLYADRLNVMLYCRERLVRGRAHVGLGEFSQALECFAEVTQRMEADSIPLESVLFPLLHFGLAECWLAQGDLSRAREEARRLCEIAEMPPERTYLAHGHRLLAETAMAEQAWDEANSEISKALEIVSGAEVPLAAWRVHVTAAVLLDRQSHSSEATSHRRRAAEVIDAMVGSLKPTNPLRISLCAAQAPAVTHRSPISRRQEVAPRFGS
jgi:DNA-binding winged helix-turn-helix (wHTH) protein/tetratricopeptide (TPR) repeat protein